MHEQHQQKQVYLMPLLGLIYTWRPELMLALWNHQGTTMKQIGCQTKRYRVCNMLEGGVTPLPTPEELKAMGFHLIVHPLTALYASARALVDVLKTLKESGTTRDHLEKMGTFEEFNQLVNLESWFEIEGRYSNFKKAVEKKY